MISFITKETKLKSYQDEIKHGCHRLVISKIRINHGQFGFCEFVSVFLWIPTNIYHGNLEIYFPDISKKLHFPLIISAMFPDLEK